MSVKMTDSNHKKSKERRYSLDFDANDADLFTAPLANEADDEDAIDRLLMNTGFDAEDDVEQAGELDPFFDDISADAADDRSEFHDYTGFDQAGIIAGHAAATAGAPVTESRDFQQPGPSSVNDHDAGTPAGHSGKNDADPVKPSEEQHVATAAENLITSDWSIDPEPEIVEIDPEPQFEPLDDFELNRDWLDEPVEPVAIELDSQIDSAADDKNAAMGSDSLAGNDGNPYRMEYGVASGAGKAPAFGHVDRPVIDAADDPKTSDDWLEELIMSESGQENMEIDEAYPATDPEDPVIENDGLADTASSRSKSEQDGLNRQQQLIYQLESKTRKAAVLAYIALAVAAAALISAAGFGMMAYSSRAEVSRLSALVTIMEEDIAGINERNPEKELGQNGLADEPTSELAEDWMDQTEPAVSEKIKPVPAAPKKPPAAQKSQALPAKVKPKEKVVPEQLSGSQAPVKTLAGSNWSVNIISFKQRKDAESKAAELMQKGVRAEIITVNVNNGVWHRLRVGGFKSKEQALDYAAKLKKSLHLNSVWVANL